MSRPLTPPVLRGSLFCTYNIDFITPYLLYSETDLTIVRMAMVLRKEKRTVEGSLVTLVPNVVKILCRSTALPAAFWLSFAAFSSFSYADSPRRKVKK